ncbi:hypothetical protein Pcinc_030277 [Petrolisthes cinctipes]|uniref:Uncharacterized protein n=1 Tax=Petrolisthes cinctipes TaxID=88211 RepID=A0AAE1EZ49_PETCI|nr:hypothetical protein Pcinc_030277 [Petrolisthes cinctipes]
MKSQVLLTILVLVLPWCSSSPTRPPSPYASTTTTSSSPTRSPSSSSSKSVYKSEVVDIKSSSNRSSAQPQKPLFDFKFILERLPDIQRIISNITGNLAKGEQAGTRIKALIKSFTPALKSIVQVVAKNNGVVLNEKNLKGVDAMIDLLSILFEPGVKLPSPAGTTNALLKDYTDLFQEDTPQTLEDYPDPGDITQAEVDGPRKHMTTFDVRKSSSSPSPKSLSSSTSGTPQQRQQQPTPQRRQQPPPTQQQQQLTPTPTITSPVQKARVVQVRVGGVDPSEIPGRRTLVRLNRPRTIPKSPNTASSRLLLLHDTETRESKVAKVKQVPITGRPGGLVSGQRRRPFFGTRMASRKPFPSPNNKHTTATTTNTEPEHINKHTEQEHTNKHTPSTNTEPSPTNKHIPTTTTTITNIQTPESNTRSSSATKTTTTTGERKSRPRPKNQRRNRIPTRRRSGITSRGRPISK